MARGVVGSDGSGAMLGSSAKTTARDGNERFVADHVLIKNFAVWENCKVSGIDRPSAEQLLEKLASVVPSITKEHMLFSKMKVVGGGKSDTIHLPVTPGFADEVQGDMVAALDQLEYTFSGRKIWVQVERAPWIQVRYSAFGRVRAFLEAEMASASMPDENLRFGCSWQLDFVIIATSGKDDEEVSHEVGFIDVGGAALFNNVWGQDLFRCSGEDMASKLHLFKGRRRQ